MIILEENFKWHLEAFASELFICLHVSRHIHENAVKCIYSKNVFRTFSNVSRLYQGNT